MTKPVSAHADPNSGLFKNEPVVMGHVAAWLVVQLGVFLISRYHIVTPVQWSAVSLEVTGMITAALLAVSAWFWRRLVTPAYKVLELKAKLLGITLPDLPYVSVQAISSIPLAGQPPSTGITASTTAQPATSGIALTKTAAEILAAADAIYPAQPVPAEPAAEASAQVS